MKNYLAGLVDLTTDIRINPTTLEFGDGEGSHGRAVGAITSISVHHDAATRPHDYDSVARYVVEAVGDTARLGPGLPYHYRIDNTGVIFRTRPLTTWLNCVGGAENVSTLAICLDGYFQEPVNETPTREQYEALGQLLVNLCEEHPEFPATYPDVRPHRDFSSTSCPGDNFAPWVYAVKDKATATEIPASAVYDWPSLQAEVQPTATTVPVAPTAPITPVAPVEPQVVQTVTPAPTTLPAASSEPVLIPVVVTPPTTPPITPPATPTVPVTKPILLPVKEVPVNQLKNVVLSKKFLLALITVGTFLANGQYDQALAVVLAFIGVQGAIDHATVSNG